MLLTTGERVSAALLTMALRPRVRAVSFTGSQVGIITDNVHGKAKIVEVKGDRVARGSGAGQGRRRRRVPGREHGEGDHDDGPGRRTSPRRPWPRRSTPTPARSTPTWTGVFSADPRIVPRARKLSRISYDEMLEMAGAGSKVLALRSVEFARNHGVSLHVRSSVHLGAGHVGHRRASTEQSKERRMEDPIISGVVTDISESKVTVLGVPDRPGISASLFEPLAAANVNVDMIVQNTSTEGSTDISFTVPSADMAVAEKIVSGSPTRSAPRRDPRRRHRQAVGRRRRDEDLPRHRRQDVPHARRRGRQHRDDLDVDDPHLGRDRQRRARAGRRALHTAFGLDSGADYAAPLPERR